MPLMRSATFLLALKRRLRIAAPVDPMPDASSFLSEYPHPAEAEALKRVILALATGNGEFAESDQWLV
jgi:hypothetical protein